MNGNKEEYSSSNFRKGIGVKWIDIDSILHKIPVFAPSKAMTGKKISLDLQFVCL